LQKFTRINNQIKSREVRVIDGDGNNLGVMETVVAIKMAKDRDEDLIEISAGATPPIAKIMDYGKYSYLENKKQKQARLGSKQTEIKTLQVKIATGEHDLELKAKRASQFLKNGDRVKIDLFLAGRAKYLDKEFLKTRLQRILDLITKGYKVVEDIKKSPKGLTIIIEKDKTK